MTDVSDTVDPNEVDGLLAAALAQFDEATEIRKDGVWLSKWPSVRFSVERALAFPSTAEAWTAWVDVTCMYNTALPFTAARSHVIGLGSGKAQALRDAIENWRRGVAPALISYIYGFLKGEAETFPPDHPRSVPGWNCINGPYVLRGDSSRSNPLIDFLQQHALVGPVRQHLGCALDKTAPFHTVSLYRAHTSSGVAADVLIDNRPDEAAGALLKSMSWPKGCEEARFLSVRHFLLCVK